MALVDLRVHPEPSPFTFDVWRCPECGYIITIEEYRQASLDYACQCCQQTKISGFRL